MLLWSCVTKLEIEENTKVPAAPGYLRGVLDNGLRYSIRVNNRVKDRMAMYLAINIGSLQEEEEQRGLAHFVEHMAFNGSKHFPGNTIIDFARENGMSFGAHVNAYTSFEETVYNFILPTDNEELLDKGLQILYDWLNDLSIEPEEVDKERGVILNEWRSFLGFRKRYHETWLPVLLEGSRFGERLPIGLVDVIENTPPQYLRDFYEKWYNTGNATVIVVGDFDAKAMQQRVEQLFGPIVRRGQTVSSGLERTWEEIPIRGAGEDGESQLRAVQMQDDDAPGRMVSIAFKFPRMAIAMTLEQLRKQFTLKLLGLIADQRFSDIAKSQSDIVKDISGFSLEQLSSVDIYTFGVQGQKGLLKEAYAVLLHTMAQFLKYGVLQSEIDLALDALRSDIELQYNEKDKRENRELAMLEVRHHIGTEYNGDIAWVYENLEEIIGGIELEDVNDMIAEILQGSDVSLLSLGKDLAELPDEQELFSTYLALDELEVAPPEDYHDLPKQLLSRKPKAGDISAEERLSQTGYVCWFLSNGIEVYFKRTDFEQNQFEYSALRSGGILALGRQFGPGSLLDELLNNVVSASGFGGLSPQQYERYMTPKKIENSWDFQLNSVLLSGGADLSDTEELFQQIYLSFTAPQFSQYLIDQALKNLRTDYDDMLSSSSRYFYRLAREDWFQNDPRILLPEDFPAVYRDTKLQAAFRQLVPSAQDFRFVFVGNITESELKNYVKQYIASLPIGETFEQVDQPLNLYEQGGVKEYALGPEDKALSLLIWDSYIEPKHFSPEENYRLVTIAEWCNALLNIRLTNILREEMGATYSPDALVEFNPVPRNRMTTILTYNSAPGDVAKLDATVARLLIQIQQGDIDDGEFRKVKEQLGKGFEDSLQQNEFWHYALQDYLLVGYEDIDDVMSKAKFLEVLDSIRKQDLADFVAKYMPQQRKIRYTMLPK